MIVAEGEELLIGNIPISHLVEKHGEPAYVYDAGVIAAQYRKVRAALPRQIEVFYSMKANPNLSIVAFLSHMTQGAEVSSLRELYVAQQAGYRPERIIFVGPSKSREEIREAIARRLCCLVVESEQELRLADELARDLRQPIDVAIRINPAFDAAGSKLKMGGSARQFGVDEEGIEAVWRCAAGLSNVRLMGIHVYVGTRILEYQVALKNTRYVLELGRRLQAATGNEMRFIDFGGGLGVPYFSGEEAFDIDAFGRGFHEFFDEYHESMPRARYVMELGRYLVADAGVYVGRVRYVKQSRGQKFVLISGGMNHHQATTSTGTLVKSHFPIEVVNKMRQPKIEPATICGPLCTPGDVLGKAVNLAAVEPGDLIGIMKSGAYGLTASPVKFLSHDHPVEVMVYEGQDFLIRRGSTLEEALGGQVLAPIKIDM